MTAPALHCLRQGFLALLFAISVLPAAAGEPPDWAADVFQGRALVRSQHGMAAASQPLAALAGIEILRSGGNAADAAVAMAGMIAVLEPMMTGVGADAIAVVYWKKEGSIQVLNSTGAAPRSLSIEVLQKQGIRQMPRNGMASVTVPGAVAAWTALLERYGSRELEELLAPAILAAENGFPVTDHIARYWNASTGLLSASPAAAANYLIDGRAPAAGQIFREPNLGRTLRKIAAGGRQIFYEGEIAEAIVAYCQQNGGYLATEDFRSHKAVWVNPISTTYRGYTVYQAPPDSIGSAVLEGLNILEGFDLASIAKDRTALYHLEMEAIKLALTDAYGAGASPSPERVAELISKPFADARRKLILPDRTTPPPMPVWLGGETNFFTVADKEGNVISFIQSVADLFGSGVVAGDTAIVLQNFGGSFSMDPADPNALAPGKKPIHYITPGLVTKDGEFFMSLGSMGGNMQPQAQIQVLVNYIDLGMNLQQAIDAPRFRILCENYFSVEKRFPADCTAALLKMGHLLYGPKTPKEFGDAPFNFGSVQSIQRDLPFQTYIGGSDARLDGEAIGY